MRFANPVWFTLLPIVVVAVLMLERRGGRAALRFSSVGLVLAVARSFWVRVRWLPTVLRGCCVGFLVVALARPQRPNERTRIYAEGIAIQMVVDNSGSMRIEDFELDGKLATRLDAVKDVFVRFVTGDGKLDGRPNDQIGLVTFANFPDVKCPLTLSHEVLAHEVKSLRTAVPSDDGTNIGDAVAWALEDLRSSKARSKVMILLTDGVNQPQIPAGMPEPIDPVDAARIAQGLGVRIYTVGAGSTGGLARMQGQVVRVPPVDETLLREMAEVTGGKYFRATDTDGLREVYREIDRLEKTKSESITYLDYRELFLPLATTALAALCLEQLLRATRLRTIP
jgi:Ca-activated chloride channel family protein